jgi:hypothetical protein
MSVFNLEKYIEIKNNIDLVIEFAIKKCVDLEKAKNKKFNKINFDSWINLVRFKNPKQINFKRGDDVCRYDVHKHQ